MGLEIFFDIRVFVPPLLDLPETPALCGEGGSGLDMVTLHLVPVLPWQHGFCNFWLTRDFRILSGGFPRVKEGQWWLTIGPRSGLDGSSYPLGARTPSLSAMDSVARTAGFFSSMAYSLV